MNLEMCNECLEYGTLNEYGRYSECEMSHQIVVKEGIS